MDVGLQLAPTTVMVAVVLLLPLPHATSDTRQHIAARIPRSRTLAPLLDLGDIHALRDHSGHVGPAMEVACVSALLEYESGTLNRNRAVSTALLSGHSLLHGLEVGTEDLLQIRLKRTFPGDAENVSVKRDKLAHDLAGGNLNFVCNVALGGNAAERPFHVRLVGLHRGNVVAQRGPRRKRQGQHDAGKQQPQGSAIWKSKGSRSIHSLSFDSFAHELS